MPTPIPAAALYRGYRFPPEIISHAVWLYLRFSLSLRDVEELLAERGVAVTYETIGQWVRKFGPVFAQELRRRGRRPGDKLHLDEVALKINGRRHWLWRAVDQHGFVFDILVQNRTAGQRDLVQVCISAKLNARFESAELALRDSSGLTP